MNTRNLVSIGSYATPVEADMARNLLEAQGIASYLEGASTVGNFWYLGNATGWVKLMVDEEQAERAATVLRTATSEAASVPPWVCECGAEVDAGFDVCWACGLSRDAVAPPDDESHVTISAPVEADNPVAAAVDRAWKASILGCVFLPVILHVYSTGILLRHMNAELDPRRTRRYYTAWGINVAVLFLVVWLFR
jgi:hypothetical protein